MEWRLRLNGAADETASRTDEQQLHGEQQLQQQGLSLFLLSSTVATPGQSLPPVQTLPLHMYLEPQRLAPLHTPVTSSLQQLTPAAPAPPQIRRKRLLPRPEPLRSTTLALTAIDGAAAPDTPLSPPPRMLVTRSTSGMSTHSTSSSVLSAADAVAELSVTGASSSTTAAAVGTTEDKTSTAHKCDVTSTTASPKPAKKKRVRVKTDRRREQCRANQARYRSKQRDLALILEDRVTQLRAEVRVLEQQSRERALALPQASADAPMQIVTEYFRLFRHGLQLDVAPSISINPSSINSRGRSGSATLSTLNLDDAQWLHSEQLVFLRAVMAPDLVLGEVCGIGALIEQWRRYSRFHDDLVMDLMSAFRVDCAAHDTDSSGTNSSGIGTNVRTGDAVHATARTSATITQATVEHVFPHLDAPAAARIKQQLVGRRVTYAWSVMFEFDNCNRVQRLLCSVDFVTALMDVLRNVEDVAVVLAHARILHDWWLGDRP